MKEEDSDDGELLRSSRMHYISYDPTEFDEHIEDLYPLKSKISIKKYQGQRGQRVLDEALINDLEEENSEQDMIEDVEIDIVC